MKRYRIPLLFLAVAAARASVCPSSVQLPDPSVSVPTSSVEWIGPEAIPLSTAFLAALPSATVAAAEQTVRPNGTRLQPFRWLPTDVPPSPPAARMLALSIGRLAYARELLAASAGYFSFGSATPPPFHG